MSDEAEYAPSPKARERDQVELYEATDGAEGNTLYGAPVVIVSHRGAQTGLLRKTPLIRVEHSGLYALIGSNGGASRDPLWVNNIEADPVVVLQDGAAKYTLTARRVHGREKECWWELAYPVLPDLPTTASAPGVTSRSMCSNHEPEHARNCPAGDRSVWPGLILTDR